MYPSFSARALGLTLSGAETIAIAARSGFVGVDLLLRDVVAAGESPRELRGRMDDAGLRGGAFPLPADWRGDRSTFDADLVALPRLADVAASLGLSRTGTWVMPERIDDDPSTSFEETLALHVDRIGAIADVLARSGIRIGLEVIGVERSRSGKTPRFLARLGELGPILDALAPRTNVGLLLDSFHLHAADERLDEAIRRGVGSIVWVHVADVPDGRPIPRDRILDHERGLPTPEGTVDNRHVLATLLDAGYDGPVTVEPLGRCRPLQGLSPSRTALAAAEALATVWPGGGWTR